MGRNVHTAGCRDAGAIHDLGRHPVSDLRAVPQLTELAGVLSSQGTALGVGQVLYEGGLQAAGEVPIALGRQVLAARGPCTDLIPASLGVEAVEHDAGLLDVRVHIGVVNAPLHTDTVLAQGLSEA